MIEGQKLLSYGKSPEWMAFLTVEFWGGVCHFLPSGPDDLFTDLHWCNFPAWFWEMGVQIKRETRIYRYGHFFLWIFRKRFFSWYFRRYGSRIEGLSVVSNCSINNRQQTSTIVQNQQIVQVTRQIQRRDTTTATAPIRPQHQVEHRIAPRQPHRRPKQHRLAITSTHSQANHNMVRILEVVWEQLLATIHLPSCQ